MRRESVDLLGKGTSARPILSSDKCEIAAGLLLEPTASQNGAVSLGFSVKSKRFWWNVKPPTKNKEVPMVKGIDIEVTVSFSGKRAGANLWQNAMADALQ